MRRCGSSISEHNLTEIDMNILFGLPLSTFDTKTV